MDSEENKKIITAALENSRQLKLDEYSGTNYIYILDSLLSWEVLQQNEKILGDINKLLRGNKTETNKIKCISKIMMKEFEKIIQDQIKSFEITTNILLEGEKEEENIDEEQNVQVEDPEDSSEEESSDKSVQVTQSAPAMLDLTDHSTLKFVTAEQSLSTTPQCKAPCASLKTIQSEISDIQKNEEVNPQPINQEIIQSSNTIPSNQPNQTSEAPNIEIPMGVPKIQEFLEDCDYYHDSIRNFPNLPPVVCPRELFVRTLKRSYLNAILGCDAIKLPKTWYTTRKKDPTAAWHELNPYVIDFMNNKFREQNLDIDKPQNDMHFAGVASIQQTIKEAIDKHLGDSSSSRSFVASSAGRDNEIHSLARNLKEATANLASILAKFGKESKDHPSYTPMNTTLNIAETRGIISKQKEDQQFTKSVTLPSTSKSTKSHHTTKSDEGSNQSGRTSHLVLMRMQHDSDSDE